MSIVIFTFCYFLKLHARNYLLDKTNNYNCFYLLDKNKRPPTEVSGLFVLI